MKRHLQSFIIVVFFCLLLSVFIKPALAEDSDIVLDFFINSGYCESCEEKKLVVSEIEGFYGDSITVDRYPVDTTTYVENYNKFKSYGFKTVPAVVVKNISAGNAFNVLLPYEDITFENLRNAIDYHILGNYTESPPELEKNMTCISTPFGPFCFNLSEISLPVITIVLGAIDSINPCSFFVLLFLLSLLFYTKSRKRMFLVGGIFIFFSGFIYFLLMVAILNFLSVIEQQVIIAVVAGVIAIVFGVLNIKDFFFFKKGPSASIPEGKKSKLYKQMRAIIKITSIPSLVFATVVLAISANTVELLCSFQLPLIYTGTILPMFNLDPFQEYMYIFFYNVVYVLPLFIIVGLVVLSLGRWKLSEYQGRMLKLFSGMMILSLGILLIVNRDFLKDVFSVVYILLISVFGSIVISMVWKNRYNDS